MFDDNVKDSNYHLNKLANLANNNIKPTLRSDYIDVVDWKKSDNIEYILVYAVGFILMGLLMFLK